MPSARALKAGKAVIELSLLSGDVEQKLKTLGAKFANFGATIKNLATPVLAFSGAVAGALGVAIHSFEQAGSALHDMSQRTGFSAESLSELKYAAEQSGASLEAVEKATKGMARFMLDAARGGKEQTDTLKDLHVSLDQLEGLSPEEQFRILSEAVAEVPDPTRRAALAMKVFGKSGTELLPLLADGKKAFIALKDGAHKAGVVLDDESAAAADRLGDALGHLKESVKGAVLHIGAAVAGPLADFLEASEGIAANVIKIADSFARANKEGDVFAGLLARFSGADPALIGDIQRFRKMINNPLGVSNPEVLRRASAPFDLKAIGAQNVSSFLGLFASQANMKALGAGAQKSADANTPLARFLGGVGRFADVTSAFPGLAGRAGLNAILPNKQDIARRDELQRIEDDIARQKIENMKTDADAAKKAQEAARIRLETAIQLRDLERQGILNPAMRDKVLALQAAQLAGIEGRFVGSGSSMQAKGFFDTRNILQELGFDDNEQKVHTKLLANIDRNTKPGNPQAGIPVGR